MGCPAASGGGPNARPQGISPALSHSPAPRPPAPTPASVPGRLWAPAPVEGTPWGMSERMNCALDPLPFLISFVF